MGFLLGAFGKQMAGSRYRSLQARMMRVSSYVRRVHREVDQITRRIDREKKSVLNAITIEAQSAKAMFQNNLAGIFNTTMAQLGITDANSMTTEQQYKYQADISKAQALAQAQESAYMTQIEQRKKEAEDYYENQKESLVDPLKYEEDELQSEKDMLEGQIQIAKQDYEACQKMEQSDAKMLAPQYTGAAG